MQRILNIVLALAAVFFVSAVSLALYRQVAPRVREAAASSGIEEVFQRYHAAIQQGDIRSLQDVLCDNAQAEMLGPDAAAKLALVRQFRPSTVTLGKTEVTATNAMLSLEARLEGQSMTGQAVFIREHGGWRLLKEDWTMHVDLAAIPPSARTCSMCVSTTSVETGWLTCVRSWAAWRPRARFLLSSTRPSQRCWPSGKRSRPPIAGLWRRIMTPDNRRIRSRWRICCRGCHFVKVPVDGRVTAGNDELY
jgi:hypothetical protein